MLVLFTIVAANVLSRLAAVSLSAYLSFRLVSRWFNTVSCLACGMLLALACAHLIPEAFDMGLAPHTAGAVLLWSFFAFILLDKLLAAGFGHAHGPLKTRPVSALLGGGTRLERSCCSRTPTGGSRALPLLIGAACHNFVDGVLIASAFMVDMRAGLIVTLAIMAHEVPQSIGQIIVLTQSGLSHRTAYVSCLLAALGAVVGGVAGWLILDAMHELLAYAMLVSAASFLFIVQAVLLPELVTEHATVRTIVWQVCAMAVGALISMEILSPLHEAGHAFVQQPAAQGSHPAAVPHSHSH